MKTVSRNAKMEKLHRNRRTNHLHCQFLSECRGSISRDSGKWHYRFFFALAKPATGKFSRLIKSALRKMCIGQPTHIVDWARPGSFSVGQRELKWKGSFSSEYYGFADNDILYSVLTCRSLQFSWFLPYNSVSVRLISKDDRSGEEEGPCRPCDGL